MNLLERGELSVKPGRTYGCLKKGGYKPRLFAPQVQPDGDLLGPSRSVPPGRISIIRPDLAKPLLATGFRQMLEGKWRAVDEMRHSQAMRGCTTRRREECVSELEPHWGIDAQWAFNSGRPHSRAALTGYQSGLNPARVLTFLCPVPSALTTKTRTASPLTP